VIILPYRSPIVVAKMLATIDQLSQGRVIMGTGAGWMEEEFAALNAPFKERGDFSDECLRIMRDIWTHDTVSMQGKFHHYDHIYSFAEIHRGESMLPSRNPCSHQHVEQGLMIPLDFLQVRARSGIGKKDLPGGPGPQGPTDPLEAQGGLRERHPRRGHLEPAGLQVLDESQPPQAKGDTGQVHEAQDGQRRCTLVIAQAEMLFQVADGQLDREPGPINFDDLEGRQRPVAYSTEFCHLIRRKVATDSTAKLPSIPRESCHRFHVKVATPSDVNRPPTIGAQRRSVFYG
jgi:hypothetical protein